MYAEKVPNARSMTLSPSGILFVGTRRKGNVYAVIDKDQDQKADEVITIARGLNMPNGVAFRDGHLYVAEVNRIIRYNYIEQNLLHPPQPVVVFDGYPSDRHHGWKFIRFGPDGKLYVPVGVPCNICESQDTVYVSLTRLNPDERNYEQVSVGSWLSVKPQYMAEAIKRIFVITVQAILSHIFPPIHQHGIP